MEVLYLKLKSKLDDAVLQQIVRRLNRELSFGIGVVVQQRTEVDPDTTRFQYLVDRLDVLQHVVGGVEEEARGHAVPLVRALAPVDLSKFGVDIWIFV